jgi:hypothetical protein
MIAHGVSAFRFCGLSAAVPMWGFGRSGNENRKRGSNGASASAYSFGDPEIDIRWPTDFAIFESNKE